MEHYFIKKEHNESDYFEFSWKFLDQEYIYKSCDDVFSKDQVDYGTFVLLKTIQKNVKIFGDVLDIGCGYGPIGIVLGKNFPNANFTLCDVNETAVELAKENVKKNKVTNIKKVILSNAYENITGNFDFVISNPPIKAGKKVLLEILLGSFDRLKKGGSLIFVIKKKFGEDSIKKQLEKIFSSVEILVRDSGYYILKATKHC